jgi:murein L,D-transpeptidase YcbB/YkuD
VKFIFPNEHFIFLHDTPSRTLFDKPQRAFSSGCIRVEHPLELAELVLDDPLRWDRAAIEEAVASKRPQSVALARPLPVFLLYWTASVDEEGRPRFLKDVYERDPAVLKALNGRFDFDLPAAS